MPTTYVSNNDATLSVRTNNDNAVPSVRTNDDNNSAARTAVNVSS